MSKNLTRRNFVAAASAAAGAAALAGCTSASDEGSATGSAAAESEATEVSYPIDPDGDDVEALWTSEETRDGWIRATNPDDGAEIGVMDESRIIQVDGLAFRDMNGNGKLDEWEDWRLDANTRAVALASELSAEDILPLMWHNGLNNTTAPLPDEDVELIDEGLRAGVSRYQAGADTYAGGISWMNAVQEACEQSTYGIPYMNSTDQFQNFNIPDNNGLAASMDIDLIERAANLQGRAWRSTGARCLLGPQIDIGTNPGWCRYNGTVSEDPALNRDFVKAFITGIQSTYDEDGNDTGWGSESILGMAKHYVGAGAVEGGRNDHSDEGKYNVFPGDNFNAHLIPFLDGALNLESETGEVAAIMPNYGIAYDEDQAYGENVGGGYSALRTSYLYNAGWDGMITTDWEITLESEPDAFMPTRAWGVEDLSAAERQLKGIKAGDDQFGGEFSVETITEAYAALEEELGEEDALARLRESARHIFKCMVNVQLFDEPYADREIAAEIFNDEESTALGVEAGEKSLVMLKNAGGVISSAGLGDMPKVYIPTVQNGGGMFSSTAATYDLAVDEEIANEYFEVLTDTVDEDAETITLPSDEEFGTCQYAVVFVGNPDGESGSETDDDGNTIWTPRNLQYREYTADGDNVRLESIAGNQVESETGAVWDNTTGGTKENRSYFGQSKASSNESDLDTVTAIREALPEDAKLILVVEATRPMCFHEIEPYCDVIFMQFMMEQGVNPTSLANILTGQTEPSALLPCQQPLDMDAVEAQYEDVPRDMDCYTDSEGNTYDFCFGLNWSGVISDERTATYGAEPLTEPVCEIIGTEA